jgi:pimeloyl-ACP methyl ester carboxylesterase
MDGLILVHGAYHGGWCWERVAPLLRRGGCSVFTPTLTGLGVGSHLLLPETDLSTHVTDIVQLLDDKNVQRAVLVGHSYGGMVISGVAEIVPERIACMIYLDALVPMDGQCVFDILPGTKSRAGEIIVSDEAVKVIMPPDPQVFGVTDPSDIVWMRARLTPMPWRCYAEPIRISSADAARIPRAYLLCSTQPGDELKRSHDSAFGRAQGEHWSRQIIAGPHDIMVTHPTKLAQKLLELIGKTA